MRLPAASRVLRDRPGKQGARRGARAGLAIATLLALAAPILSGQAAAQDGVDGNTYVSPNFGYELEWDDDVWEVGQEDSNGRDFLSLLEIDGTSVVYVEGYEDYDGDPEDCLEGSSAEILEGDAISDVEPLEDENDEESDDDDGGVAFSVYSYVYETDEGDEQDRVSYFTCQTLVEDEAVLAFSFTGLLDAYEDDLPIWDDLFNSLTLPDNDGREDDDDDRDREDEEDNDSGDDQTGDRDRDDEDDAGDDEEAVALFGGGPAHTGEQPGPAPADEPEEAWAFETGDDFVGANPAAVSVEDGLVFTSSNAVYAIDIETGEEVWTYESEANVGFVAPLALADGVLFAAGEDGSVYAFEPDSGDILWQAELTEILPVNGGPLVVDDKIYVTAWDGNAYAIETETGDLIGSTPIGGISYGQPTYAERYIVMSDPAGGVLALPLDTDDLWQFETDGTVYAPPVIVEGTVYFASDDGSLYAVELEGGEEIWSVDTGAPINTALAVTGGVVYVANGDAVLGAYDADSGDELWTVEIDGSDPGGIAVTENEDGDMVILVGDGDGVLHAFDEEGDEVFAVEVTDAEIFWPATVIDGTIYVSARDGTVYALAA